jgi:hypothetical protein
MTDTDKTPPRIFLTEDGYRFTEQADGTWSDGDLTFGSLEDLQHEVDGRIIEG